MYIPPNIGFKLLGLDNEQGQSLFFTNSENEVNDLNIKFHLEKAEKFKASAVFFVKELEIFKPQIYIFDCTLGYSFNENELKEIHKKVWTSGVVPLVVIFYDTELKILDCTEPSVDEKPKYLINQLYSALITHRLYNEQFAIKIKSGVFWDIEEHKNKFKFNNSAYDILIKWIKELKKEYKGDNKIDEKILNKVIIQSILIKYLEERQDNEGRRLFNEKYFKPFGNAINFVEVLRNSNNFIKLLNKLHIDFNGNLFDWTKEETNLLENINLNLLADALEGYKNPNFKGQQALELLKYYEFSYVPVELISRLYEEFLGENKQENGLFYTPAHLAKLLVDESMPLKDYSKINLKEYKLLDPACGSGIFLVLGYKRIVQWWRLQNDLQKPSPKVLKQLLKTIFGTDKEKQATKLAAFSLSLALCDELSPMEIISDLRFDDLTKTNILFTDFFIEELNVSQIENEKIDYTIQKDNFSKIKDIKFDLVIGNPPFDRGAIGNYSNKWKNENIKIPQGQIALKFLSNTFFNLKEDGLQCLIIKSSGLLYNSSSEEYKKILFSKYNVVQILDFTALARNKSLWDNGADVASAAIFTRNQTPNFNKNILHVTFRRTKSTRERIFFEINEYDLNFVNRNEAIQNQNIWKINLLGGGRIKNIISDSLNNISIKEYCKNNDFVIKEGHGTLNKNAENYTKINNRLISKVGINGNNINYETINIEEQKKIKDDLVYYAPNIIISETLDLENKILKFVYNDKLDIIFKNRFVGIAVNNTSNLNNLKYIENILRQNNNFYVFYSIISSAQVLINLNTSIMAYDIYNLPLLNKTSYFSKIDKNIIKDVNIYYQEFLRHGESSEIIKPIEKINFENVLTNYGKEFSYILNEVYQENNKKYRLSDVISLFDNSFIATVFKYDDKNLNTEFHEDNSKIEIEELTNYNISKHLNSTRIIKLYDREDTIIFIKPNQYRYWLSLIAYRDADKTLLNLYKAGY